MSGTSHRKEYMIVFVVLAVLTVLEVVAADLLTGSLKLCGLLGLAVAKAACVGIFYMHLKTETQWLRFIAILPVLMGFYVYVLAYEVIYR